ncbi:MAG TPA: cardiolipin synthase [Kofleriaceae bacterium]
MSWHAWLGTGFAISALVMAVVIVQQRRSPAATIAWLLVLSLLPIVGWLVYRFIGPLRLERKKLRRRVTRAMVEEALGTVDALDAASPAHRGQLARVAIAAGEAPPLRGTAVALFTEGDATYAAISAAIAAAQHHVHLEYYIWEPDETGTQLRDQLVARATAGVEIRVIVDGSGSSHAHGSFWAPLRAAGGRVAVFNPVRLLRVRRPRVDFRLHRKSVICDGAIGFVGGTNVTNDESVARAGDAAWRDTHLRLEGPAVRVLQRIFAEDWLYAAGEELAMDERCFPRLGAAGGDTVQIVASGPDLATFAIHKLFFAAINQATSRIWLTTPYFVPDDAILTALVSAALRGVDVRILVPARGDSRLVDMAARSYFPDVIAAGARVYEYTPRFIHAKTFVIDDDVSIVATANLDNRSFRLDFEIAAVVYGAARNAELAAIFDADLAHACALAAPPTGFWPRLGQSAARLLSPLLAVALALFAGCAPARHFRGPPVYSLQEVRDAKRDDDMGAGRARDGRMYGSTGRRAGDANRRRERAAPARQAGDDGGRTQQLRPSLVLQ